MIVFPNAKINIGLKILRKRDDGYHDLDTVLYPIGLKDILEFVENDKGDALFTESGMKMDLAHSENLVIKAYRKFKEKFDLPGLNIHLHKNIPFGAGLGGGSSDAAFMLTALNKYFNTGASPDELKELACHIGSDCSFFIENTPSAISGRGDIITPTKPYIKGWFLVLIKPPIEISTAQAYANVTPSSTGAPLVKLLQYPVYKWKDLVKNDFEKIIFHDHPKIGTIKNNLYKLGATYASMSGSGSSVFGLFKEKPVVHNNIFPANSFIWEEQLS